MNFLETQLIDMVQKQSMAFILQDLKCVKCHGVSDFAHLVFNCCRVLLKMVAHLTDLGLFSVTTLFP